MKEILLYDLKIDAASVKHNENGTYEIHVTVDARKFKVDGRGNQIPAPMEEELEIGLFKAEPDLGDGPENVLYLKKHFIHSGKNQVSVTVNAMPGLVAVDPYLLRIDANRFDNMKPLRQFE